MPNPELLMQLLMDSTSVGVLKACQIDDYTYVELESGEIVLRSAFKNVTTPECVLTDSFLMISPDIYHGSGQRKFCGRGIVIAFLPTDLGMYFVCLGEPPR